jgi:hypothetical protein
MDWDFDPSHLCIFWIPPIYWYKFPSAAYMKPVAFWLWNSPQQLQDVKQDPWLLIPTLIFVSRYPMGQRFFSCHSTQSSLCNLVQGDQMSLWKNRPKYRTIHLSQN